MSASDRAFAGAIPEVYDRFLVPLIFEYYADDLAARLAKLAPRDVLEIAAGTGALTRPIHAALPAHTRVVATDLNEPMLQRAMARHPEDSRITWRQADALNLPFQDRMFDAVACQFGAMFFPDKVRGYAEALRVLKPGGHFIFNVWDRISENQFAHTVSDAVAALFPSPPPDFMARIPHGYHDVARIRDELTEAGFASVSIDNLVGRSRSDSPRTVAIAFCQGTPLRSEIDARDPSRLEEATEAASLALTQRFGGGPIEGRMSAFIVTAVR